MPKLPPKIMNEEIKKYQGRIYFLEFREDACGNPLPTKIIPWNIESTEDYNHYELELHHVIKYSDYEKDKEWYASNGLEMCLILLPKILHQHLENPIYSLDDEEFFAKYHIHKHELLFNKKNFNRPGAKFPQILLKKSSVPTESDLDELLNKLEEAQ